MTLGNYLQGVLATYKAFFFASEPLVKGLQVDLKTDLLRAYVGLFANELTCSGLRMGLLINKATCSEVKHFTC